MTTGLLVGYIHTDCRFVHCYASGIVLFDDVLKIPNNFMIDLKTQMFSSQVNDKKVVQILCDISTLIFRIESNTGNIEE